MSSLKCFVGSGNVTSTSAALLLPSTPEGRAHHEATQDSGGARPEFRIEECGTRDDAVSLSPAV